MINLKLLSETKYPKPQANDISEQILVEMIHGFQNQKSDLNMQNNLTKRKLPN